MQPVDQLRVLVSALETGEPLPAELAMPLAWGVRRYLANAADGLTLDSALGLAVGGQQSWWLVERRGRRDAAIQALGALATAPAMASRARHVAGLIAAYRRSASWKRDQYASEAPPHLTAVQALAWTALMNGPVPEQRQIQSILAGAPAVKSRHRCDCTVEPVDYASTTIG